MACKVDRILFHIQAEFIGTKVQEKNGQALDSFERRVEKNVPGEHETK